MRSPTDPLAFGQVWAWDGTRYMLVAPDPERTNARAGLQAWLCLYVGEDAATLMAARAKEGRRLLDSMAWMDSMEKWERIE